MVPVKNIAAGIARYADTDIVPKLPDGSLKKAAIGIAASIIAKRGESIATELQNNSVLKTMQIVDGNGGVDVDLLREALAERITDHGIAIAVPMIGTMTFHRSDVDKLYSYIMGM